MLSMTLFDDHLKCLDTVLARLSESGLNVNAQKSHFCTTEVEYLGYRITQNGIYPLSNKVEAIINIEPPKTCKQLCHFIGMVNYYRDMCVHRSELLVPLTKLTSSKQKFVWTDVEQTAFDNVKKLMSKEVMLAYPDFTKPFVIHTDASHLQLSLVISQNGKPITFYSRKLNPAQT
jgi:hypothetical protein